MFIIHCSLSSTAYVYMYVPLYPMIYFHRIVSSDTNPRTSPGAIHAMHVQFYANFFAHMQVPVFSLCAILDKKVPCHRPCLHTANQGETPPPYPLLH